LNIAEHLQHRGLDTTQYSVTWDDDTACFLLFNLSGKIVGYQQYRPDADKVPSNDPKMSRYFTWAKDQIAVWGLETYHWREDVLFFTEGVFDACKLHNLGLPAVAVLSNNPQKMRSWISCLPKTTVAICDDDDAGYKLAKLCDRYAICPQGQDLGDMTQQQVVDFIKENFFEFLVDSE
jgi:hypothetical protein